MSDQVRPWLTGWCTGENNGNAKLSDKQVAEVRRLVAGGMMQKDVAARFGISRSHVSKLVGGRLRAPKATTAAGAP